MAKTSRFIKIIGSIDEELYANFALQMDVLEAESKTKEIKIELYSDGGYATVALAFYSRIRLSSCPITILGTGLVASAATLILVAGDKRLMTKEAWFMTHEDGIGKFSGKVTDLETMARALRARETQWNLLLKERTGISLETWNKWNTKDFYLTAEECLDLGIVEGVI